MALDINNLLSSMVNAAKTSLKASSVGLTDVAISSLKTLAQCLVNIEQMKMTGTISEEQANLLIDMQKNAVQTAILTEEGLGLLAAQNAINSALSVVSDLVNTAIGWTIL